MRYAIFLLNARKSLLFSRKWCNVIITAEGLLVTKRRNGKERSFPKKTDNFPNADKEEPIMYTRSRQNKILSLLPTLALILCLVICAFAFASCGPKKPASTEPATTPATTDGNSGVCQHVWGEFEVDTPATCTAPGSKSKYCTLCDVQDPDSITEIPQLAHTPADEFSIDKEPTCSAGGFKSKHCTVCGNPVADTVLPIDPDPTKHVVEHWTVTEEVNMFHQTGSRTGECTACHQNANEVLHFEPTVETFTSSTQNGYTSEKYYFVDVRGEDHFYPDNTTNGGVGNDLFIEYSLLWNPTLLNLDSSKDPYIKGSFEEGKPILYYSPVAGCKTSAAHVPGAFEWMGNFETAISDGEVSTPDSMMTHNVSTNYADFPNLGGAVEPDADNLNNGHEWGWHRIGVRYHLELISGKDGDKLTDYVGTATVYLDGVAIFKLSTGTKGMQTWGGNLFKTVDGGVTYTDVDGYVIPIELRSKQAKADTTVYFVYADVSVTCGKDFKMPVERVTNPADATLEVAEDVNISAPVYFKLAD